MENLDSKKMALCIWLTSILMAIFSIIPMASGYHSLMPSIITLFTTFIPLICQMWLGYVMYRDINDTFTMVSVIIIGFLTFNLAGVVAVILRLVLRSNDSDAVRSAWFVPAIVQIPFGILSIASYASFFNILNVLLSIFFYLIFGYWLIKYLKVNKGDNK